MSVPIEDYALIGDGESAALVSRHGSIDWLCWPRFDDDACFAALLGSEENGRYSIAPCVPVTANRRRYRTDTLIIETEFETASGTVRLIDFMPMRDGALCASLVRIVEGVSGEVPMTLDLRLRFDYGSLPPWLERHGDGAVARLGPDMIVLHPPFAVEVDAHAIGAAFTVRAGDRHAFVMRYGSSHGDIPGAIDAERELTACEARTVEWIGRFDATSTEWPDVVKRSLLTLKAMIHQPSGGLVAAPTTSLPESPGGTMNWDYRYCWLRDATFTLEAFLNAGYTEEATAWRDWLLRAVAGSPERMRIMYRVDGARHLSEWEVEALPGYDHARPVRIGNAASTQHQIDVYGEVLGCLHLARSGGVETNAQEVYAVARLVDHLATIWNTPGSGIWESRETPRQYTYSKVMAWVGIDCAVRTLNRDNPEPRDADMTARISELSALRANIHDIVCREGWNEGLGTFTQYFGGHEIDASLLLLPIMGFLPADDPRIVATVETIARELSEGGLIRRSKAEPGKPAEGTFLACSCWMADCLRLLGRTEEARAQFERVLAVANDVHLLAEEYNVPGRRMNGNFPQALSHLAVVNTALGLCGAALHKRSDHGDA